MLLLADVGAGYGALAVLHGITLEVRRGTIVTLLGANGAGKTTTLKAITGLLPFSGAISFDGHSLKNVRPDRIVRDGISMVPERRELFVDMTVGDNLTLGAYTRRDYAAIEDDLQSMLSLFPRLRERYGQLAGTMSGGEQQMLAVARALMARPRLLLLDEPSLGLAPLLVEEIFDAIARIRTANPDLAILLVEQNANMSLEIADYAYVMDVGSILLEGPAHSVRDDPGVQRAYLSG